MELWYIKDGEKHGPVPDYEIRNLLRNGEITLETSIWHQDLEGWTPIGELETYQNEVPVEEEEEPESPSTQPPALPTNLYPWRRFAARWFDWFVYEAIFLGALLIFGVDLAQLFSPQGSVWLPIVMILPWVLCEAICLTFWGTTPGKWLVGLAVRSQSDEKLAAWPAIVRTFRAMILGMAFGIEPLAIISHGISFWLLKKKRVVLWDAGTGSHLKDLGQRAERWVAYGVILASVLVIQGIILFPVTLELQKNMEPVESLDYPEDVLPKTNEP